MCFSFNQTLFIVRTLLCVTFQTYTTYITIIPTITIHSLFLSAYNLIASTNSYTLAVLKNSVLQYFFQNTAYSFQEYCILSVLFYCYILCLALMHYHCVQCSKHSRNVRSFLEYYGISSYDKNERMLHYVPSTLD